MAAIAATIAIPFVLRPGKAGEAAAASALVAACLIAIFMHTRWLRRFPAAKAFRRQGKRHRWAIDLRVALLVIFGLGGSLSARAPAC